MSADCVPRIGQGVNRGGHERRRLPHAPPPGLTGRRFYRGRRERALRSVHPTVARDARLEPLRAPVFEDCEAPCEHVLGEEGRGTAVPMSGLDYERVALAGGPPGIMAATGQAACS